MNDTDNSGVDLTLEHGDEYAVFYLDGPYRGNVDTRISTDGSWDAELYVIAAVNGKETQLVYTARSAKRVGHQVQVSYAWDQPDSEALEAVEERGDF